MSFNVKASFRSSAGLFEPHLFKTPKDRFSHDDAPILIDMFVQMNGSRVEWMVELIYMNGFHFQVIFSQL